jgi:aspartate/methionine/tyrosine aminotransferase
VAPNNPTGRGPTEAEFRRMCRAASATGTILVCDFSFRFYSDLQAWDQYAIAEGEGGLDYLFIEDTGKTWPARELKVGMLSASEMLLPHVGAITDEVMLNVSPFTLSVLARFIRADQKRRDRGQQLHSVATVSTNRMILRERLDASPLRLESPASQISVEWVGVPEAWETTALCRWLDAHGVTTLPGNPFYWQHPEMGRSRMRIALMRETAEFRSDVIRLIDLLDQYPKR